MAEYTKGEALDWARQSLRGQWTTLVTPFTADDHLDEQGLRSNIRRIRRLGTEGAGCTWGMGEFWSLTREERLRVYDVVSEEAAGEWPIAAHVTHTSAREMVLLAKHAEAVGFDLLIVAPPYMVTRTEQQVIDYVKLLANETPLAIMFYNSPQFGIVMSAEGLREICAIPNVVGVKEVNLTEVASILRSCCETVSSSASPYSPSPVQRSDSSTASSTLPAFARTNASKQVNGILILS